MALDPQRRGSRLVSVFLSAQAVSYRWRGRALVDAVSLEVESGGMTVLIGPNGAGKSTLMRLMSGELRPSSGAIMCEGENVVRLSPGRLALKRAVMTQAIQVSSPFLTYEIVRLGLDGIGRADAQTQARIVERCLDIADALHLASRPYAALSGGEQRRVQFARVLAQIDASRTVHDRQALLLDEPVANLDLPHQLAVLDAAQRAAGRGVAVLSVLHDLNLAGRYADTLALMNKGAIVAYGTPASVQTSRLLSDVFEVRLAVGTTFVSESPVVLPSRWLAPGDASAARDVEGGAPVGEKAGSANTVFGRWCGQEN
jgi:iron complex transport system ATP-binding protein